MDSDIGMNGTFFIIALVLFAVGLSVSAYGKHTHLEKWYQEQWCLKARGNTEIVLPDRSRVDCLTKTHAIEFDFGSKWAESIGQSLYYGVQTGKRPGIVLILENPTDYRYFIRLNTTIKHFDLPIDTWKIGP